MKAVTFSKRCAKEIIRDPLNLFFGIGFPVVLLLLLSAIQANIPVSLFEIKYLAPGIAVFGLSFITLFSSTLVAKDRESAFLQRLYTTPLKSRDFILGYILPLVIVAVVQSIVTYLVAILLSLPVNLNLLVAVLFVLPISIFYVSLGVLCGSVFNVKQVGGICGGLLTNLSAWLSGVWFDLSLIGGVFESIASFLPFVHAVELQRAIILGDFNQILPHLAVVMVYALVTTVFAIFLFFKQKRKQ